MLLNVLWAMTSERLVCFTVKVDRIEFVISHDCASAPVVDHPSDSLNYLCVLWPSVDEVAQKYRLPMLIRMFPTVLILAVAKIGERSFQLVCMSVDVRNNIEGIQKVSPEGTGG